MKRKIITILILFSLISTEVLILTNSSIVINSVLFGISIWKENVFPSLFPFFVLSELLINYGFIDFLSELFKNIMNKYFNLPGSSSFILIGSLISGFPSSAKYIKELYDKKEISKNDANYLLTFNHFSNPLFIIGTIGNILLKNKKIAIVILICHIFTNFIIALIFKPKNKTYIRVNKTSIKKAFNKMHCNRINKNKSFASILSNSIFNTINTLILILGIIITFLIITNLLTNTFNLPELLKTFISGILEMTSGIKYTSLLNYSLIIKASLITFFISFGGLSVHFQIMSIISDTDIKYKYFFIARIFHSIISSCLVFLILSFISY